MRLQVDKQADALYLRLDDSAIVESVEVAPGVVLDYNQADQVVGVEMLRLSTRSPLGPLSSAVRGGVGVYKQAAACRARSNGPNPGDN